MTTDITLGNQRLLQLADILDASDQRHQERGEPGYLQTAYTHPCGSPACALGEWAAANPATWFFYDGIATSREHGRWSQCAIDFAIGDQQYDELFGRFGCGNAKTAKDAANYIRAFVARRQS